MIQTRREHGVHVCVICECVCVYNTLWRVAVKFGEGVLAGPHADFLCSTVGSSVSLKGSIVPFLGPLSHSLSSRVNTGYSS